MRALRTRLPGGGTADRWWEGPSRFRILLRRSGRLPGPLSARRDFDREPGASPFDERAALQHLSECSAARPEVGPPSGCPGTRARSLPVLAARSASPCVVPGSRAATPTSGGTVPLSNWPVQLHLVPSHAPYLREADLLLVADCVPLACPDFHARFMDGRPVLVGCPKLDDAAAYERKLAHVVAAANVRSVQVVRMEVPCCAVLGHVARCAAAAASSGVPVHEMEVSLVGKVTPVEAREGELQIADCRLQIANCRLQIGN